MSRSIASFLAAGVGAVVVTSVVATPADTTVSVSPLPKRRSA